MNGTRSIAFHCVKTANLSGRSGSIGCSGAKIERWKDAWFSLYSFNLLPTHYLQTWSRSIIRLQHGQ